MTTFRVRVDQCRFTLQGLSGAHLYPDPDQPTDPGPIIVSRLDDGAWFVHNGRHRVIRARLNRLDEVDAVTLDQHHAEVDAMNAAIVAQLPAQRTIHWLKLVDMNGERESSCGFMGDTDEATTATDSVTCPACRANAARPLGRRM